MKKAQKEEALRTFEIPADFQAAYKSLEDYLKTYAYRNYQEKIKDGAKFDDMRDFFIERCRYVMKYFDEIAHYGLLDFSNLTLADSFFLNMNVKNNFVSKLQFSSMTFSDLFIL